MQRQCSSSVYSLVSQGLHSLISFSTQDPVQVDMEGVDINNHLKLLLRPAQRTSWWGNFLSWDFLFYLFQDDIKLSIISPLKINLLEGLHGIFWHSLEIFTISVYDISRNTPEWAGYVYALFQISLFSHLFSVDGPLQNHGVLPKRQLAHVS